jgi:hypothetical protein
MIPQPLATDRLPMKTLLAITFAAAPLLLFEGPRAQGEQPTAATSGAPPTTTLAAQQTRGPRSEASSLEQFNRAEKKYAEAQSSTYGYGWSTGSDHASGSAGGALVVLASERDAKAQAGLEEDLAVMSHILDKAVQQKLGSDHRWKTAMGINVLFAPGSSSFRSLYLEDYGALFTLHVGFPLLPPPAEEQTGKEKTPVDSAWDEAKQELYGHHPQPRAGATSTLEPYSQEKVDGLKEVLLEALKNASHIRDLKPEEYVALCVFGGASATPALTKASSSEVMVIGDDPTMNSFLVGPGASPRRGTVLTLRAKKADVDSFARGELTPDQFRKRVGMASYVGTSRRGDRDNPYVMSGAGRFGGSGSYGSSAGFGPSAPFQSEPGAVEP